MRGKVVNVDITPQVLEEDRRIIKQEIDNFLENRMISFDEAIEIIMELKNEYHKHSLFSFR